MSEALEREGGAWGVDRLRETGELAGSARRSSTPSAASATSRCCAPTTGTATASTRWTSIPPGTGCCARPWSAKSTRFRGATRSRGAHAVRAALMYTWSQVNSGVMCPVSMTYSVIPALRENPDAAAEWEPRLVKADYEGGALAGMAMTEKQGGSDVRTNRQPRRASVRRHVRDHRPQVVLLVPPMRRLPHTRPDLRGPLLLPDRGARSGLSHPAPEGQAGHPLAAVVRGGVPRGARPPRGRGGPRRGHDHPDGQPHAAGLPDRLRGRDALGGGPGGAPCAPPLRVRRPARSSSPQCATSWPTSRSSPRRPPPPPCGSPVPTTSPTAPSAASPPRCRSTGCASAHRHTPVRRWSASGQRVRGGVGHAPPAARLAAQFDLGGVGQRGRPRRPAGVDQGARGPAGLPARGGAGGGVQRPARCPHRARPRVGGGRWARMPSGTPAAWWRTSAWRSRARCWCATPRPPWPTRSAPHAWPGADGSGRAFGTLPGGVDAGPILDRALAV